MASLESGVHPLASQLWQEKGWHYDWIGSLHQNHMLGMGVGALLLKEEEVLQQFHFWVYTQKN